MTIDPRVDESALPISEDLPFGVSVPERVLQEVLKAGIAQVKADTSLLDELFHKYDKTTLADMKSFYAKHNIPVRVNFPVGADWTFPMIAIVSAADTENASADFLGSFMGADVDLARTTRYEIVGHATRSTFTVYCLAGKDSNAALWLYYVVKALLVLNYDTLINHGLHNATFDGRDIQFREDVSPEFTFARTLSLTCDTYFAVQRTERVANSLVVNVFTEGTDSVNLSLDQEE